jgi:hypothetical protein
VGVPDAWKFDCGQRAALGSFRACCPLCVRTRSGRPSSGTRRSSGLFVSGGDPRLFGRILAAYGRGFDPRELLAYLLLHVHSNLPECLREFPAPPAPTLDALALTWFGTA